jgi:hypothetical protein
VVLIQLQHALFVLFQVPYFRHGYLSTKSVVQVFKVEEFGHILYAREERKKEEAQEKESESLIRSSTFNWEHSTSQTLFWFWFPSAPLKNKESPANHSQEVFNVYEKRLQSEVQPNTHLPHSSWS